MRLLRFISGTLPLFLCLFADAANVQISATTTVQAYQVLSSDNTLLNRTRLMQSLQIGAFDLTNSKTNQLYLVGNMRFETDFGNFSANLTQEGILGYTNNNLYLMFLFIEGTNFFKCLDFKVGRQFIIDDIDFYQFDGALVRFNLVPYIGVGVYSGLQVKKLLTFRGFTINPNIFELDGTDETSDPSTVIGTEIYIRDLPGTTGKIAYRRTFSGAIDEEKFYVNLHQRLFKSFFVYGGYVYNILLDTTDRASAGFGFSLFNFLKFEFDYLYSYPSFSGDSIFNVFSTREFHDVSIKVNFDVVKYLRFYASYYLGIFKNGKHKEEGDTAGNVYFEGYPKQELNQGIGAGLKYMHKYFDIGLESLYQEGYGGMDLLADFYVIGHLFNNRFNIEGRFTFVKNENDFFASGKGEYYGLCLVASFAFSKAITIHLIGENNFSPIYKSQYKIYSLLELNFFL